jgi:hypothetical protein
MPDHEDAQDYTANGPTNAGFKTNGTGIANGVVAGGNKYGVHGIGLGTEGSSAETAGVYGESGLGIGVHGWSNNREGVFGRSQSPTAAGVSGAGNLGVYGYGKMGGSRRRY